MFGYIRFILAVLVLMSHAGRICHGVNQGVVSVVLFYMLAGYVVTQLLNKVFERGRTQLLRFYLERILRIFPLYLFVLFLTTIFVVRFELGQPQFRPLQVLGNLLIVPLNYYMYWDDSILTGVNQRLVPVAWSLGAELQAYVLLPFIIRNTRVKIGMATGSIICFAAAAFQFLNTDYFGYRLLPGILFIFILGSCIYTATHTKESGNPFERAFPPLCFTGGIFALLVLGFTGRLSQPYILEVILGMIIGIPVITYVANTKVKLAYGKLFGDLSYGVFLAHNLGFWTLQYFAPSISLDSKRGLFFTLTFSMVVGLVGIWLIEKPCFNIRSKLARERSQPA